MRQVNNFSDLGKDYVLQLFSEIITDHKFGLSIIDILEPKFFGADAFSKIAFLIKNYYIKHECLLNFPALRTEININIPDTAETFKEQILDTVDLIENSKIGNLNVQKTAQDFCKFQSLKTAVNAIKGKLDKGILDDVEQIEETLKKALTFKEIDDPITLTTNIDDALADDYREPIPTGIAGIDINTGGGLSRGEVGLIIAALGVGKSTILTFMANHAYLEGYNVLHIYFEDRNKMVQRKHYTKMTGVPLNDLSDKKEFVKERVEHIMSERKNNLHLIKLPVEGATTNLIKNIIKRINSKGVKIDLLIIDYLECISMEKTSPGAEDWSMEGQIMRKVEAIADEMNVATWIATQGGRQSTGKELVEIENMGGNLKKAQIGHLIVSIGRSLPQKEQKVATMAILKNRMGEDGVVFANCRFDIGKMEIDTMDVLSIPAFTEQRTNEKETTALERARAKLKESKQNS